MKMQTDMRAEKKKFSGSNTGRSIYSYDKEFLWFRSNERRYERERIKVLRRD